MSFVHKYRELFDLFGYPLARSATLTQSAIDRAAKSLGITLPAALRDFYIVAGREKRFSQCHHRIIAPKDWRLDKGRLVFMEENQWVVWWSVSARNPDNDDPPVWQAANVEDENELEWHRESNKLSVFLSVMLHYQAVSGGFDHNLLSSKPKNLKRKLRKNWRFSGSVNKMEAYSRPNQVVCIDPQMGVAAAARTKAALSALEDELELESI